MDEQKYIKIEDCKVGYLYRIEARNGEVGIYSIKHDDSGDKYHIFTLSRHKFGSNFLFPENHYDDPCYGTAQPLEELEKVPEDILKSEEEIQLKYLNNWTKKLKGFE